MIPKFLLTPTETAKAINFSRSKTYDLIRRGVIPSVKIDGVTRVPVKALEAWIASLERQEEAGGDQPPASDARAIHDTTHTAPN